MKPLTIIIRSEETGWYETKDLIIDLVRESGANCRVKSGIILSPEGSLASVAAPAADDDGSRRITSRSFQSIIGQSELAMRTLVNEISILDKKVEISERTLANNALDCISLSDVSEELASRITLLCRDLDSVIAIARWDITNPTSYSLLWGKLILSDLVSEMLILTHYIDDIIPNSLEGDSPYWCREPDRSPELPAVGFFIDILGYPLPELKHETFVVPADISPPSSPVVSPRSTPLQRIISSLETFSSKRPLYGDLLDQIASFSLPDPTYQFPDIVHTVSKVGLYCLATDHPEKKYTGFAKHGYGSADSVTLASYLCGVMLGDFEIRDPVLTSSGEIRFSIYCVVPSRSRLYMKVQTVWSVHPDTPMRLLTAWVTDSDESYAYTPSQVGGESLDMSTWTEIVISATEFGTSYAADTVQTFPGIFIPRSGGSRALATILIKEGWARGDFTRRKIGGRAVSSEVGDWCSWSEAVARVHYAQYQLGLRGVLSMPGVYAD